MLLPILELPISHASLVGMVLTALVLVVTPGPNTVYLVSRSISQGRTAGLVSLAGTGLGFITYMLMANLGLAIVFVVVPWLFIGLKAVGVVYLASMVWRALRPGGTGVFDVQQLPPDSNWKLFRMGLVTNLLNPKTAIMYLTLIPQFVDHTRGHVGLQGVLLGAVQIAISLSGNAVFVLAAGTIAGFLASRPLWSRWQRYASGTMLGAVTLALAAEVPQHATA